MDSEGHFDITGLILARGGSVSIPLKNLSYLNGETLLGRAIKIMKMSNCFKTIYVSTDNEKIASCAERENVFIHNRLPFTASDNASSILACREFLDSHLETVALCLVQCTSPFLKPEYLKEGEIKFRSDYDSVFSVTRRHLLRWQEGENTVPVNFDPKQRPRRQDWKGELCENGMFYYTRAELIYKGLLQGERCGYIEIPVEDSLDIDSPLDLAIAERIFEFKLHGK